MTAEETKIACAERLGLLAVEGKLVHQAWCAQTKTVFQMVDWSDGSRYPKHTAIPNFYGSLDAAMLLVEKAKEMGWTTYWSNVPWPKYRCYFIRSSDGFEIDREADSPSAAICEAFLKLPV